MDGVLKQAERLGRFTTTLGEDVLVLLRFEGSDYLNELFEYRVEALATRDDLDFDALIGTHATVEIEAHDVMRPFDGIVTSAQYSGVGENGHIYTLTLRPWFWLAGKRRNYRIFHRKTVDQILRELLSDYGVFSNPHLEIKLGSQYEELEYTVQHGVSDLEFTRRQMERHGISFHFRHELGSHTLVLTDDELAHEEIGEIPFKRYDGHHQYEFEHFWDWKPERNFTTGAVLQTDYNFKHPYQKMDTWQASDAQYAFGHVESFDYPGDYLSEDPGKIVTRMRQRQERGADRRNRAVGDCVSLASGQRVTLGGDKVPGHGETYLCLSATHRFVSEAYGSGGAGSDGYSYSGSWVLMPDTAPMVPPKRTPLSRVYGPQTAMVVGEGEIDCDEHGRILVRFHWDLEDAYSMRCRVGQSWASQGWGGMVIPRIGMEVVVEFLEGDPDKPLVTGCVYNGRNNSPYPLPAHKTKSVFRSDTHRGNGFNEVTFEDQTGQENMFFHAQKDQTTRILNNRTERVDAHEVTSVGDSRAVDVGGNQKHEIGGSMNLVVGGTGAKAFGLMAQMAGLAGQTSALLGKAGTLAGGGGAQLAGFVTTVASSALGFLGAGGLFSRDGVVSEASPRPDAGAALAQSGAGVGEDTDSLFPFSGIKNTVVGAFQSDTVGIARAEQIGLSKVTNVGATQMIHVGKEQHTTVGDKIDVKVGKFYNLVVGEKYSGESKIWNIHVDDRIRFSAPGGYIELNKSGIRLHGDKIEIQGNRINFAKGGPGEGTTCLKKLAKSSSQFVRM